MAAAMIAAAMLKNELKQSLPRQDIDDVLAPHILKDSELR